MATLDYIDNGGASCPAAAPRIYVACLAAYNNGCLHGEWIDANQDVDGIWTDINAMLKASPEPGAEEWAIHDYEGFGKLRLSEYESIERVAAIAAGIEQHGDAFSAWLSYDDSMEIDSQAFEHAYQGEWHSMRAYAHNYAEEVGMFDAAEATEWAHVIVDIDGLTRDLDIELYTVESDHYTVYVFDPNA